MLNFMMIIGEIEEITILDQKIIKLFIIYMWILQKKEINF